MSRKLMFILGGGLILTLLLVTAYYRFDKPAAIDKAHSNTGVVKTNLNNSSPMKAHNPLNRMPLYFEANRGQADAAVLFMARGEGYTLFLTREDAVLLMRTNEQATTKTKIKTAGFRLPKATTVRIRLANAKAPSAVRGLDPLPTRVNYFIGNDPARWRSGVPTYSRVAYREVYPGIDLVYYGNRGKLEFDFIVSPGADLQQIGLEYTGVDEVKIADNGQLILKIDGGELHQSPPKIYQKFNDERQPIEGNYVLTDNNRIGFEVAEYAANHPLIIDPMLEFSSYLGGSANDRATDIAVDNSGNIYVCGYTLSADFPTTATAFDTSYNLGFDGFVAKIDTASGMLSYATYLGGSGDDRALGIDVDEFGSAFVTGRAWSTDFPYTSGAYQTTPSPAGDAFVSKLNINGSSLIYSTYLGANGAEEGRDISVDDQGRAHFAGWTGSTNFPVTANAYQLMYGGLGDAFLARFSSSGNQLSYATYLGGNGIEEANSVALDDANRSYLTGVTYATDFPTTGGAFQETKPGGQFDSEAFAASISSSANYVSYLGGNGDDVGYGISVNNSGNAFVTGRTASGNFPTANAFQNSLNGGEDGFVTKFNFNGSNIDFSTFLGGGGDDIGTAVAVDNQNRAYITGVTRSGNFPTQNSIQSNNAGGADAYVTRFESSGANLEFSTYFGGSADDTSSGITVDGDGNFYFTGYTLSGNFPTMNAFQGNNAGASDVFIAWIAPDAMPFDDCNNNGVPDSLDIVNGTSQDCNNNWIPDECDIASGNSGDCNNNGRPDECDIGGGMSNDCNNNGIPDECELMGNDCNNNGIPDDCELAGNDCNNNGVPDDCDIAAGAPDCNNNGVLDECELQGNDCNNNGILDECEDLINPTPINSTASINIIPNHDHSSEPVCDNFAAAISADGRFIAFESRAENLVPDDNNDAGDVFVYDAQTGNLERVSVSSSGQEANGRSTSPSISEDGQLVAFVTGANNLVPNDSNGVTDVFVHNRQTGVTVRASVSSTGEEANRGTGRQTAMISGDGRYVKFHSSATNLVPNDSTLNEEMFVRDLQNGVTVRPVAFNSNTFEITTSISQTGRFMTFSVPDQPELDSLDINFDWDVYIHDRDPDENGIFDEGNGITELISVSDSGQIGNNSSFSQPYASADGRYVVFASQATNFVPNDSNGFQSDLFVHDRLTGMKEIVSVSTAGQQANAHTFGSLGKYMSDDGRFVTFATTADNLVSGDTNGEADIFLHDRHLGTTQRISLSSGGPQANGGSSGPAINTNGQYVAFSSDADNLVPGDVDNVANVFLVDIDIINSISEQETVSRRSESFRLFQNYPNPFNPSTTIEFSLPRSGEVSLKIFNALGQEVTELVHQRLSAGYFKVQWNAATLPSGTYFYRLKVGNYSETRRLILFK